MLIVVRAGCGPLNCRGLGQRHQCSPRARELPVQTGHAGTVALAECEQTQFIQTEQWSRPVDEDLLGGFGLDVFVGSFDEFAGLEEGAGADEGDRYT